MINDFNNPEREKLSEIGQSELTEFLDEFQDNSNDSNFEDVAGANNLKKQFDSVKKITNNGEKIVDKAKEVLSEANVKETVTEFAKKFDESKLLNEAGAEITEYTNKLGDTESKIVTYSDYVTESYVITDGEHKGMTRPERLDTGYSDVIESSADIIGEPIKDIKNHHKQELDNSCAVACNKSIIESLTGKEVDEAELREVAKEYGYTDNNGTPFVNSGKIAEHYGLKSEFCNSLTGEGLTIENAMERIENGEKLIAAVDTSMLYFPEITDSPFSPFMMPKVTHAVEIIGFDKSNPGDIKVIINDPGFADGAGNIYSWDDFKSCCSNSFVSIL